MSKLGSRMIQSATEALAYASGEQPGAFAVHSLIDVKSLRDKLGMSQPVFAVRFGLSVGTIRDWEQGRAMPDGPARVLLRVIKAAPELVERIVGDLPEHAAPAG